MSEADVNAAMYVQFEADSNVILAARLALGGLLSSTATAYDLTQLLAGRFVATLHVLSPPPTVTARPTAATTRLMERSQVK